MSLQMDRYRQMRSREFNCSREVRFTPAVAMDRVSTTVRTVDSHKHFGAHHTRSHLLDALRHRGLFPPLRARNARSLRLQRFFKSVIVNAWLGTWSCSHHLHVLNVSFYSASIVMQRSVTLWKASASARQKRTLGVACAGIMGCANPDIHVLVRRSPQRRS